MKPVVFDTWAILAFLKNEPSAEKVAALLHERFGQPGKLMLHEVNAGEIWYITARKSGSKMADQTLAQLQLIGLEILAPGWEVTRQAAVFKSHGGLSFADAFSAALAKYAGAVLVTGDHELEIVIPEVDILWLR